MRDGKQVTFYLPQVILDNFENGVAHQFFTPVRSAFEELGFEVVLTLDTEAARKASRNDQGYNVFYNNTPTHARSISASQTFLGQFWQLEKTHDFADRFLAGQKFKATGVSENTTVEFLQDWSEWLFEKGPEFGMENYILIPLQAKLSMVRHWQYVSAAKMVATVLEREPERHLLIYPDPQEVYSEEEETLFARWDQNPAITILRGVTNVDRLIANAAYIVTINSPLALRGLFHRKQSLLFGHSDFHHINRVVKNKRSEDVAFEKVFKVSPNYARYLYWYFQIGCLDMQKGDRRPVRQAIIDRVRSLGWDI